MQRAALALIVFALLTVLPGVALAADGDSQTLTGEFVWERSDKNIEGPLEAIFESTGKDTWNVVFNFTFEDEPHIYKGTAEGSLENGTLKGKVMTDDDEPRPFTFEGTFKDGQFSGTHAGERDGKPSPTGTMSLSH